VCVCLCVCLSVCVCVWLPSYFLTRFFLPVVVCRRKNSLVQVEPTNKPIEHMSDSPQAAFAAAAAAAAAAEGGAASPTTARLQPTIAPAAASTVRDPFSAAGLPPARTTFAKVKLQAVPDSESSESDDDDRIRRPRPPVRLPPMPAGQQNTSAA
jgi:hypothetical protein